MGLNGRLKLFLTIDAENIDSFTFGAGRSPQLNDMWAQSI